MQSNLTQTILSKFVQLMLKVTFMSLINNTRQKQDVDVTLEI